MGGVVCVNGGGVCVRVIGGRIVQRVRAFAAVRVRVNARGRKIQRVTLNNARKRVNVIARVRQCNGHGRKRVN